MLEIAGIQLLPETARFLAFAAAGLAWNIVPGPNMTFVMASAGRSGARSGLAATLGISAGAVLYTVAAAVGMSAVLASSQVTFVLLKWLGGAYLLYTALSILRGGAPARDATGGTSFPQSHWAVFQAGACVTLLNAKAGLFYLAFLPQFVDPAAEFPALQIFFLGLWLNFTATCVNTGVAVATARIASRIRHISWIRYGARAVAATALAALAVRLVVSERQ